jgi:TPR repeat protein
MRLRWVIMASLLLLAMGGAAMPEAWAVDREDCAQAERLLKTEPARAVAACRRLADQGVSAAQYVLGVMYETGQGVTKDDAEAVKLYRKAADHGQAAAQFNLAMRYYIGSGVPMDPTEMWKWMRKAADGGIARAQYILGQAYGMGDGMPQDYVQAYLWFSLAAAQRYANATEVRAAMSKEMTPAQIEQSKALVAAWKQTTPGQ